jgi:uncharacterized SAM-binding protein YcdF (DUF218 family)
MLLRALEVLCQPPAAVLALCCAAWLLRGRRPRTARALLAIGVAWLWLFSTPVFAAVLLRSLEHTPPLPSDGPLPTASAIVVLSAEADPVGAEYGRAVIGPMTMQRLRYGIELHRRTGLPLLVSGGHPTTDTESLAAMMATAAEREFLVPVRWREQRSSNTRENALFSAAILRDAGVGRVLLVSSAFHLPRASACFERAGLEVVPAPTGFAAARGDEFVHWLPQWRGLRDCSLALHEWLGRAWDSIAG